MNVKKLYRCHCGREEAFRAVDNIPQYPHYCKECYRGLQEDDQKHCVAVYVIKDSI